MIFASYELGVFILKRERWQSAIAGTVEGCYNKHMIQLKKIAAYAAKSYIYLYAIGIVVLGVTGALWWKRVYTDPGRVFWGAVANNLTVSAATAELTRSSTSQKLVQQAQFDVNARPLSRFYTIISQDADAVRVKTESLGTSEADYNRYTEIKSNKPLATTDVVNVWAKTNNAKETGSQLTTQALVGPALGAYLVPFGNLSADRRDEIVSEMKRNTLYKFTTGEVKKETRGHRPVYIYKIEIQPVAYVQAIQQVAQAMGVHDADELNPSDYVGMEPLKGTITVDVLSRQIIATSDESGYTYRFGSIGVPVWVSAPQQTISGDELRKRLTNLQQAL